MKLLAGFRIINVGLLLVSVAACGTNTKIKSFSPRKVEHTIEKVEKKSKEITITIKIKEL